MLNEEKKNTRKINITFSPESIDLINVYMNQRNISVLRTMVVFDHEKKNNEEEHNMVHNNFFPQTSTTVVTFAIALLDFICLVLELILCSRPHSRKFPHSRTNIHMKCNRILAHFGKRFSFIILLSLSIRLLSIQIVHFLYITYERLRMRTKSMRVTTNNSAEKNM